MGEGLACPVPQATAREKVLEKNSPQGVSQPPDGTWDAYLGFKSSAWSDLRLGPLSLYQSHLFAPLLSRGTEGCFFRNKPCSLSQHQWSVTEQQDFILNCPLTHLHACTQDPGGKG